MLAVSSPIPQLIQELQNFFGTTEGQDVIHACTSGQQQPSLFSTSQGLLFFRHQIFVPTANNFRQRIMTEFHTSPYGGHFSIKPTLKRIAASFYWPKWTRDVHLFIQQCSIYQKNKYMPTKTQGLLQPLPIPKQVWEDILMDFITHLPVSAGHSVVWVICDRLTKYAHFIALPTHFTTQQLARRFSVEICRLHGIPKTIVSDRDPLFISTFWQHLFKAQGTMLKFSSSYHPQTDGQTEVLNRGLKAYLRCFVGSQPNKWYQYLHLVELWHNTTHHSAIGTSPFHALYGRHPPTVVDFLHVPHEGTTISTSLAAHIVILHELREHLRRTRQRMCDQANRHRTDRSFEPGDWVWVRLQPYRQRSLEPRKHQKLGPCFSGPYKILRRIGVVAYEFQLPASARVHPVFHVSLLKPFKGPSGEHPNMSSKPTDYISPTTLNSSRKVTQNCLDTPRPESNTNATRAPCTAGPHLPDLEPNAHAPPTKPTHMPNSNLHTPSHTSKDEVPRVRSCASINASQGLEPNTHVPHQQILHPPNHPHKTPHYEPKAREPRNHITKGTSSKGFEPSAGTENLLTPNPNVREALPSPNPKTTPHSPNPYAQAVTLDIPNKPNMPPPAQLPFAPQYHYRNTPPHSPTNSQVTQTQPPDSPIAQLNPELHFEDKVSSAADSNVRVGPYISTRSRKQPVWMKDFIIG